MSGKDGGWVLPTDVHPTKTVCFKVVVPDERMYLAAFFGALWELQYWFNWQRDSAHTAIQVADVWRPLLENLKYCDGTPVNQGFAGADGGDELMLRQNPDKPCLLETSVNGVDWCVWADLSLCGTPSSQPGEGSHQPAPDGGSACYDLRLQAGGTVLVPTIVSEGDVITIQSASGAGTDGTIHWFCPDGHVFFAGTCAGAAGLHGGDPMATAYHMDIVAVIDGTYYKFTGGELTVPSGVSNKQVTLQVNDDDLSDNSGEYTLSVCVQNNQSTGFTHTFDFLASDCGFVSSPGSRAVWTLGSGWGRDPGGDYPGLFQIQSPTVASRNLTSGQPFLDTPPTGPTPGLGIGLPNYSGTVYSIDPHGSTNPIIAFAPTAAVSLWCSIQIDGRSSGEGGVTYDGHCTKLIVTGEGTDPF